MRTIRSWCAEICQPLVAFVFLRTVSQSVRPKTAVKTPLLLIPLLISSLAVAGISGIGFVYQPLTPMGTDQEAEIIIARIPVIADSVPESTIGYVSAPNKLLQLGSAAVEDSNLLSCLNITVSAEWVSPKEYSATLDLSRMKPTEDFGVTEEAVVKAAVQCIRKTIDEIGGPYLWKVRIVASGAAPSKWAKFEFQHRAKSPK